MFLFKKSNAHVASSITVPAGLGMMGVPGGPPPPGGP